MLYGAIARAARALGYRRLITYTLASESGTSLRAVGWHPNQRPEEDRSWEDARGTGVQRDIFGNERVPLGPKVRWECDL
jgi:hypothetical protein